MNDPDSEKTTTEDQKPEPQETGTGLFGGSFINGMGMVLLSQPFSGAAI